MSTLESLPLALQQSLLLEWLSPETVWTAVRASGTLRRAVLAAPKGMVFRAADKEVLSGPCVRWFRERSVVPLCLWTCVDDHWFLGTRYFSNGKLHRDGDMPAIADAGTKYWFQHGQLHRDGDMPAVIQANGTQCWYQHGQRHRGGDLPARIESNGTQHWYQDGFLSRDGDEPAVIKADGTREWWQHGELIRANVSIP